MSTLLSQLGVGVNPLSTAVGQRIEQATDSSLPSEDWALNMEICDIINETDEGPKDALRAIRKRLQQNAGKNYNVVMHTLVVLETCVKNCGTRFQLLATQKDFVQDLVKLIGPKNDPPSAVQEKVLLLIQSWANAFRSNVEMQGVVSMYNELKQKGITFPSPVEAPVLTPSRAVSSSEPVQQSLSKAVSKLEQELRVVRGNLDVFNEMLNELVPGQEHHNDRELLQDLYRTCQNMQSRIVELIDRVGNEKITEDLLSVNDELNQLFVRYEQFEKQRTLLPTEQDFQNALQNKPLIDLDETDTQQQLQGLNLDSSEVDEFSALAQSRSVADAPLPVQSAITEFAREQDIEEVARWLDNKPEDLEGHSDFERFLASRAAAAEQLPTLPSDKKS